MQCCVNIATAGREIFILADLAYIGTGKPEEDRARMATFTWMMSCNTTIFVSSFSKTHTLTGERFGWVTTGDARFRSSYRGRMVKYDGFSAL